MPARRQLLWIGSPQVLESMGLDAASDLETTWIPDPTALQGVERSKIDAAFLVADSPDRACAALGALAPWVGGLALGVGLAQSEPGSISDLVSAGACRVFMLDSNRAATRALIDGVRALVMANAGKDSSALKRPFVTSRSPAMKPVMELVRRAQSSQATVLVLGETGTGKELIARMLCQAGARRSQAFIPVNCAAFPDALLESELFGHQRGSFTGAHRDHSGVFVRAHEGTVFLDEIGETSPAFQSRLLRVLQEGEVRPVGATRPVRVDVRVIAATHRPLQREVAKGRFREDLYYRLAVFPIVVPPLRERPEDILPLVEHFVAHFAERDGKAGCTLAQKTRLLLTGHDWPGNVRELENSVERAIALADPGASLEPSSFGSGLLDTARFLPREGDYDQSLRAQMDRVEALLIRRALDRFGSQKTLTARHLGITREGLYKKMKRLGIR